MKLEVAEALIAAFAAAYPNTSVGAETVMLYATALADLTPEEGAQLVARWTTRERRWPSLAEMRTLVAKLRGETAPDIDRAWREVRLAFGVPEHRRPAWSHPAIGDAVDALGMEAIGRSENAETIRAQFERYYARAVERRVPESTMQFERALGGELKRHVLADGRPVKLIGGKTRG